DLGDSPTLTARRTPGGDKKRAGDCRPSRRYRGSCEGLLVLALRVRVGVRVLVGVRIRVRVAATSRGGRATQRAALLVDVLEDVLGRLEVARVVGVLHDVDHVLGRLARLDVRVRRVQQRRDGVPSERDRTTATGAGRLEE